MTLRQYTLHKWTSLQRQHKGCWLIIDQVHISQEVRTVNQFVQSEFENIETRSTRSSWKRISSERHLAAEGVHLPLEQSEGQRSTVEHLLDFAFCLFWLLSILLFHISVVELKSFGPIYKPSSSGLIMNKPEFFGNCLGFVEGFRFSTQVVVGRCWWTLKLLEDPEEETKLAYSKIQWWFTLRRRHSCYPRPWLQPFSQWERCCKPFQPRPAICRGRPYYLSNPSSAY